MAMTTDFHTERLIQRAKRAPKLSEHDELDCIRAWQARRDRRAAQKIVEANLRHVVFIAIGFRNYGTALADLISEGSVGLMLALDRFDEAKRVRFATYATYWIRAHVVLAVLSSWSVASGARGALSSRIFFRLRRERARLMPTGEPDAAGIRALATRFGVSERRMEEMLAQIDQRGTPIEADGSGGHSTLLDELVSHDDQEAQLALREIESELERAIERARPTLSQREAFILDRRLMADPEDELSLNEIGSVFGVSRERVRQLEVRTRAKLQREVQQLPAGSDVQAA